MDPTLPTFSGSECEGCARIYDELVVAIVKAVPGIEQRTSFEDGLGIEVKRPITLEDVLRTAASKGDWFYVDTHGAIDDDSRYFEVGDEPKARWIVGRPLSDQSDKLKTFLHSVLCP